MNTDFAQQLFFQNTHIVITATFSRSENAIDVFAMSRSVRLSLYWSSCASRPTVRTEWPKCLDGGRWRRNRSARRPTRSHGSTPLVWSKCNSYNGRVQQGWFRHSFVHTGGWLWWRANVTRSSDVYTKSNGSSSRPWRKTCKTRSNRAYWTTRYRFLSWIHCS